MRSIIIPLFAALATVISSVVPNTIYDGGFNSTTAPIALRIGNGGAGQSGLIKVLADAFIQESVDNGSAPFRIAWILSDNTFSIKYFKRNAERIAIAQGIARSAPDYYYLSRDHFLVTGPPENPAALNKSSDVTTMFSNIFQAADRGNTTVPVRFLSRFDKSATNIKESELWLGIGQVPWSTPYSTWYHQFINFPIQALTAAIQLKEYTLTDRGTYLSIPANLTSQTVIYKVSTDKEDDLLLNPAHLLVAKTPQNETMALSFAKWATSPAGQKVITSFQKNGEQLYSGAP